MDTGSNSDDFEFVDHSECSRQPEDDVVSLAESAIVSLDSDGTSECGCESPCAVAASALIEALEDAGRFDRLQGIIQEAMASIHVASAADLLPADSTKTSTPEDHIGAPTEQQLPSAPEITPSGNIGTIKAPAAKGSSEEEAAAPTEDVQQRSSSTPKVTAASSSETSPQSPKPLLAPACPTSSSRAVPQKPTGLSLRLPACTARGALLLLLGAYAAAVTILLLQGGPAAPVTEPYIAAMNPPYATARSTSGWSAGALSKAMNAGHHSPLRTPWPNSSWSGSAAADANGGVFSVAGAASKGRVSTQVPAAANLMLSCPQYWSCRHANKGVTGSTHQASMAPAAAAGADTSKAANVSTPPCQACQATTAGCQACQASIRTSLANTNMSLPHRLCTYLWSYHTEQHHHAAQHRQRNQRQIKHPQVNLQLMLPAASPASKNQLQLVQACAPPPPPLPVPAAQKQHTLQHQPAAPRCLKNTTFNASSLRSETTPQSLRDTAHKSMAAAVAAAAAAVRFVTRPTKPVPPLYRPAPPCLSVVPQFSRQGSAGSAAKGFVPAIVPAAAEPYKAGSELGAWRLLVHKAASIGGLTLPMLPPLVYAQPPSNGSSSASARNTSSGSSSSNQRSVAGAPAAAAARAGLALPMLPPVEGHKAVSGDLTLPMLPPVTCVACDTQLQLLSTHSSRSVAALSHWMVPGLGPKQSMAPSNGPPSCRAASLSTCTAAQQQYNIQQQYWQLYSQQYKLQQQERQEAGAEAAPAAQQSAGAAATGSSRDNGSSSSISASASSNRSSSAAAISMHGSWVTSFVSFPMLLPINSNNIEDAVDDDTPSQQKPGQQKQAVAAAAAAAVRPAGPAAGAAAPAWACSSSPAAVAALKADPPLAVSSFSTSSRNSVAGPAAQNQKTAKPTAAYPHDHGSDATVAAASVVHSINKHAFKLQQPLRRLLQLVGTVRSRSLQCTWVAADAPGMYSHIGSRAGGKRGGSAYWDNNAAYTSAAKLLSVSQQLQHASSKGSTGGVSMGAESSLQLQQLCAEVGSAHRKLQTKLAAAVFKPHSSSTSSTYAPAATSTSTSMFTSTPAHNAVSTASGMEPALKGFAAASQATAVRGFAIPLGPVGVQPAGFNQPIGRGLTASPVTAAAAPLQGPLQQQLAAAIESTRALVHARSTPALPATAKGYYRAAAAGHRGPVLGAKALGGAATSGGVGGAGARAAGGGVWTLNAGWDHPSARTTATVAGQLGKAEGELQQVCQQLPVAVAHRAE